ncbi:protein MGARP [Ascaphus truei]|uniref:protein MGARP n=1 Tax=Ascaphus truei TaxID=8439 RepID=UPI003F5AC534
MHLCRAAWQKLAPLATSSRGTAALLRNAPLHRMSSSSVPGSSGSALPYYLLVGVSVTAGGVCVYRTLASDRSRFQDRHTEIDNRPKQEWTAKAWPPKGEEAETSDISEASEEAPEVVAVEVEVADDKEITELEEIAAVVEEDAVAAVEEESVPTELDQTSSLEAAAVQGIQNIESAEEVSDASPSPVLEASSESIQEELASAAEDLSEHCAIDLEEATEMASQATEES